MPYKRISELRRDSDLTQDELANILQMSRNGYTRYEYSAENIPTWLLICLSQLYHVSTDYILGLTDERIVPRTNPMEK